MNSKNTAEAAMIWKKRNRSNTFYVRSLHFKTDIIGFVDYRMFKDLDIMAKVSLRELVGLNLH